MNNQVILKDADLDIVSGGFKFQAFGYKVEITKPADVVMPSGNTVVFDYAISIVKV